MSNIYIGGKPVDLPISGQEIQELAAQLDEVSLVIRFHLMTERLLEAYIRNYFGIVIQDSVRLSFIQKLELAELSGFDKSLAKFLRRVNKIRNLYAHSPNYYPNETDVENLRKMHNDALPSKTLEVNCDTFFSGKFRLRIKGHDIPIELSDKYEDAQIRFKLLTIFCMFLAKIIPYVVAAEKCVALSGLSGAQLKFRQLIGTAKFD